MTGVASNLGPLEHSARRELFERHIAAARESSSVGQPDGLVVVQVEAPAADAEAFLQHFPEQEGVLWSPPHGPEFAGLGVAESIEGHGATRFAAVIERAHQLWSRVVSLGGRGGVFAPRLFGGFAFSAAGARSAPWRGFGTARFVLPRVVYARQGTEATLSLTLRRAELRSSAGAAHMRLFQRALDALAAGVAPSLGAPARPTERSGAPAAAFCERISASLELIRSGELQKVVAAQELHLRFPRALEPLATAIALRDEAPGCVRFVFRWGESAFVGATPECLLSKRGNALKTEALAGSVAVGAERPELRLQGSLKELEEHQLVVASIVKALEPLCTSCRLPAAPEIRRLKHLLHLRTPISAELKLEAHVVELLARLHPTPAVGGVPTERALDWLARHEPFDRGWYAGAVGWFDASGDGDFNVALRSGLLRGQDAWLYAGAGIVKDSVPQDEYEETNLKLVALLAALRSS